MLFSAHGFAEHKVFFQEYVDYVIEATLHTRFYPHFTSKKLKFTLSIILGLGFKTGST